jgi:hypothetical protein
MQFLAFALLSLIGVDRGFEFAAKHPMIATPCSAHQVAHHLVECAIVVPYVLPALPWVGGVVIAGMWVISGLLAALVVSRISRAFGL